MGPNNAKHVVWTLGDFFFFSLRVFLILINVLDVLQDMEGYGKLRLQ